MISKHHVTFNILLIVLVIALGYVIRPKKYNKLSSALNFTEIASGNGYSTEEHQVITEDGYVLKLFRVTHGRNCFGKRRGPPVVLMHGLLQSSDAWLDAGPNAGLAYLIADSCFDIWVGNTRGNYYSRSHVRLNPNVDHKFWEFSVNEIGYFDLPAIIDHVLNYTRAPKLNYIGYSQGAGTFFIMCSERPGYCDKVQFMIALAPATRHLNTKSTIYRTFLKFFVHTEGVLKSVGIQEVLRKGSFSQEFLEGFCSINKLTEKTCIGAISVFDGDHPRSITNETSALLFKHFPAGTSVKNLVWYGQSIFRKDFFKFDYGDKQNLVLYGSVTPPTYNLSAVTVPVIVMYGANDGLVDTKDVKWLVQKLPNVVESSLLKDAQWNHFDVTYSQFVSSEIFPKVRKYLFKYSFM